MHLLDYNHIIITQTWSPFEPGKANLIAFSIITFQVIFIWFCIDWTGISYNDVQYPGWAEFLGWMLCISAILCVPGYAIHRYLKLETGTPYEVTTMQVQGD